MLLDIRRKSDFSQERTAYIENKIKMASVGFGCGIPSH